MVTLIIACILLEMLFIYIAVVSAKGALGFKRSVCYILLIVWANLLSGLSGILVENVFRYLFVIGLNYFVIYVIYYKRAKFYDALFLNLVLLVKLSVEFTFVVLLGLGSIETNIYHAFFGGLGLVVLAFVCKDLTRYIYSKTEYYWNLGEAFYLRYILSILFVAATVLYFEHIVQISLQ